MPFGIGIWEIAILLLVVLLIFGPKKLPEIGRQLGKGMREFKGTITDTRDEFNLNLDLDGEPDADPAEPRSIGPGELPHKKDRDAIS